MKCPKCGYHSFENLSKCKKCDLNLALHKRKFNLKGFYVPLNSQPDPETEITSNHAKKAYDLKDEGIDLDFDFLDDERTTAHDSQSNLDDPASRSAGSANGSPVNGNHHKKGVNNHNEINLDQPFSIDSETVPADKYLKR